MDKLRCCLEVDAHVKATGVMSLYAHVGDLRALVDVWLDSAFTVSCIEDVGESMPGQISPVLCTVSEKHNAPYSPTGSDNTYNIQSNVAGVPG